MDPIELRSVWRRGDAVRTVEMVILQEKAALDRAGLRLEEAFEAVGVCNHSDVERCYRIAERLR
ncbi:hypothetical protein MELA_01421 [Candidatus Methylomirabilis lanthanidiphila]|uniref:Uncharacterized protein n=1 Tax=Candidatus Methylomirabilis lanthanidiphila TaxID=2211376 RepID=A0A564ZIX8_9BACT|nr:hypothetical protein MELA_01421 [Candidatus Methylomirabilis lanthanidiphila]